jgi:hypothetical protein
MRYGNPSAILVLVAKLGVVPKVRESVSNDKHIKKNRIKVKENLWAGNMGGAYKGVESAGTQPLLLLSCLGLS